MPLDLIYFTGGPREAVYSAIRDAGHTIKMVVSNDPDRWPKVQPTLEMAAKDGVQVQIVQTKSEMKNLLPEVEGELCFSAGFNYLFDKSFLTAASSVLNVHGSLLPKYPGARTLPWAIENGEQESGVTVHLVDEGMDTGAILCQRPFPLSKFETTESLARKTALFEPEVVVEALAIFETSGAVTAITQPIAAKALPNRVPEHSELDPELPLSQLFNKIRAADPKNYPAHFYLDGQKVCIQAWRPLKPADETDLI